MVAFIPPVIALAVARAIVGLAGREGPKAAIKKYAQKYGDNVVDRAQIVVQRKARDAIPKSAAKEITASKIVGATAKQGRKIRAGSEARKTKPYDPGPGDPAPLKFKKGGAVKSSREKSHIDGIARKGKTKAKHR